MSHLGQLIRFRLWRTAGLVLLPLALSSCGGRDRPTEVLYPTKGQVFYQGSPAAGAMVILHPVDAQGEWKHGYPNGVVTADGTVAIQSGGEWDGAPEGEYAVLVIWMETPVVDGQTSEEETEDKLGGRYANSESPMGRVKVESAPCEIPRLDLQ
jgi:hypothetical protein